MSYLLATSFAGSATGATSTTSWAVVSGAAFTPDGACAYTRHNYSGAITSEEGCAMEAGVQLPHGATVTGVFALFDGNGDSASVHLEENDSFGGHNDIAAFSIGGCEQSGPPVPCLAMDTTLSSPNIDNIQHSYGIWVSENEGDITLYRVAIRYTAAGTGASSGSPSVGSAGTSVNPGS